MVLIGHTWQHLEDHPEDRTRVSCVQRSIDKASRSGSLSQVSPASHPKAEQVPQKTCYQRSCHSRELVEETT